jgi:hypothetical protein
MRRSCENANLLLPACYRVTIARRFASMEVEWPPVREAGPQRVWRGVLQPIAAEMRRSAAELAERTVSHIQIEAPDLFPTSQIVEEARGSTEESLR